MTCTARNQFKRLQQLRKATSKGPFEGTFYCIMFWPSHSEPQTYVTNANIIDGGSNIVHRPISPKHAIMHCVPLYCIQPLYSHYTARGSDVGGVGALRVGAPAELSGEINKWGYAERIVQRRSGIDKWEYADRRTYCTTGAEWSDGEFPGQNRPGHDSVPWTPRPRAQTNEPSAKTWWYRAS